MDLVDLTNWAYGDGVSKGMFNFATKAGRAARAARVAESDSNLAFLHANKVQGYAGAGAEKNKRLIRAMNRNPQAFRDARWENAQSTFPAKWPGRS